MAHRILATALLTMSTLALVACGATTEAAPSAAPATITVAITIVDDATAQPLVGSVFVDGKLVAQHISADEVAVSADRQLHRLRVEAAGCEPWRISVRSPALRDHRIKGPARLRCGAAGRQQG